MPDSANNGSMGIIFKLVQDTSNHVMQIVKDQATMRESMASLERNNEDNRGMLRKVVDDQEKILHSLQNKMTPERCVLFHDELRKTIRVELIDGVKGWGKTAITILKIAGWAAILFGGSAVGAHQMGWLNSLVGGGN